MIKNLILGNKYLQNFFWKLLRFSAKGLNYDRGHVPCANGEIYSITYAMKFLSKTPVIFDVGANKGQYLTMLIQNIDSKDLKIHSFEPQKSAYELLLKIVSNINREDISVNAYNFGLSNEDGEVLIYSDSNTSEFASFYRANYIQLNKSLKHVEKVTVTSIDNFCNKHNIENIDYLKIDVEGHELEVLRGAKSMLERDKIKFIQFEFGLASVESRVFLKDFILLLSEFQIYRILPRGLKKIEYTEYCELFLTTNYLAINKNLKLPI